MIVRYYCRKAKFGQNMGKWVVSTNICMVGVYVSFGDAVEGGLKFHKRHRT